MSADVFMPTIGQYMALAQAMHDLSDDCNANYAILFHTCEFREQDIQEAVQVLVALRKEGWLLVNRPADVPEFGL